MLSMQVMIKRHSATACNVFLLCTLIGGAGSASRHCEYRCRCGAAQCQLTMMDINLQPMSVCEIYFQYENPGVDGN